MGRIKIILVVLSSFLMMTANAQNDQSLIVKGNELYKKQAYDQAAEAYKQATQANAKNAKAQFNLGNALYQQKQREAAAKAFQAATESSKDKNFLGRAFYNQGVAFTRDKKLEESIDAYKQSLRKNPEDQDTRENLQKALNELKKQQQQNQDQKNNNNDNNNNNQDQKPQSKSNLNKNQVERMLNALRQEEQRLQQNKQSKSKAGGPQEKDW